MKTNVMAALVLLASACGVSDVGVDERNGHAGQADESSELSTTKDTYVLVRRDYRRCVSPLCGGFWVRDLNSRMQDRYVNGFDFAESNLSEALQNAVTDAPENEVVVYGRLGPKEPRFDTRSFQVKLAFRGMPGKKFSETDIFYGVFPTKIACLREPCATLQTTRLNRTTGHTMSTDIDVRAALAALVSEEWLMSRAFSGKTVLAGSVVKRAGGYITVTANQVFVQLPDRVASCVDERAPACPNGQQAMYDRTAERCTMPTGKCSLPAPCPRFEPRCDEGYRQVQWMNVCPRYACEPAFLEP